MKRFSTLFILILFFVGCQLDEIGQPDRECAMPMIFNAGIEKSQDSDETKTVLGGLAFDSFRNVLWEQGDEVYITNSSSSSKFINNGVDSSGVATLAGKLSKSSHYYAAYPFHIVNNYSSQGFEINLPSEQTYQRDGVSSGSFPMVAQFKDGMFHFKNLCGILVLNLKGEQTVSSITFRGRDEFGKYLNVAGAGLVSMSYGDFPELDLSASSETSVVLDCPGGVSLNSSTPTLFHIILPAMTYDNIEILVETVDGNTTIFTSDKPLTIKRSMRIFAPELYYGVDLSRYGTANSYIISAGGNYKFNASVKGNSIEPVGAISSASVLWESFGTDVAPSVGDLIKNVSYSNNYITFETNTAFRKGNAVIVAEDESGSILWSWHIWLTDEPREQEYYNYAGTMMDRNLGATSATPGDVCALGLLYQWGRKDPFLGSSSISESVEAKSTITWPSSVSSTSSTGTIDYATKNPTTFITDDYKNFDWYYMGSSGIENTRWTTSNRDKSMYDPCPPGWRVPDGGSNGVWSKAVGSSSSFDHTYNSANKGMDFSGKFGSVFSIWYPASGYRSHDTGSLSNVGVGGSYWSSSSDRYDENGLGFDGYGHVNPSNEGNYLAVGANGKSVRCIREDSYNIADEIEGAIELSSSGTANSYIVSESGIYKFKSVQGNSNTSIGTISSTAVLWESFGTDVTPSVGSLVINVSYRDGYIVFQTNSAFKKGNAVIAARDEGDNILWSWHIWFTDEPLAQEYYNNAGTMMDRNLGATSATPGDVGTLGLLYQWGRKDPFLSSSSLSVSYEDVKSTINWPNAVDSDSSTGTIDYATKNPTTFISGTSHNSDWCYAATSESNDDNPRWTTSNSAKSIYDPCPAGWRVPDGGNDGVWVRANGSISKFENLYDGINEGMNFSGKFGGSSSIWYPAVGCRSYYNGSMSAVGDYGYYWSSCLNGAHAYYFSFNCNDGVSLATSSGCVYGRSVRCFREGSGGPSQEIVAIDLSSTASANSYVINEAGTYKFKTVQGNRSISIGSVASAEVLWESFGTDVVPSKGDLVKIISYDGRYIVFQTSDIFKEGNAVIAAKDAGGNILWSWHIWLTDELQDQVYYNGAGTMMDRNLGATSTTPGDVGALGLLYQWGRKDPFLGSSSISESIEAKSTIIWPSVVSSNSSNGTIAYATKNPTTFIKYNSGNYDWYYTGSEDTDTTRWTTSDKDKSIYDPCPPGWRVPDGGSNGVWLKALGSSSSFSDTYNSSNEGINFSGKFGSASTIWYPASGSRGEVDDGLDGVGHFAYYWSASSSRNFAQSLYFIDSSNVHPLNSSNRACAQSLRCYREGSGGLPEDVVAIDLSSNGTANSYIVSEAGAYKFKAVQGNSYTPVGSVVTAEVLWESFGTDVTPSAGTLVKNVSYSDGYITFQTNVSYREGNAVIGAKDVNGDVLWSWHIWLTEQPNGQAYYDNSGTVMDRNLGATSATPGDVGALGLLYQWGRKDPFLSSSSISSSTLAKSTVTWPSAVSSTSSTGTIAYATKNPTTFITYNSNNNDWYYTGSSSTDNTRWTTSDKTKSIYDPCPPGWRVPNGGSSGVWSKAVGSFSNFIYTYNSSNEGMNFSGKFGSASTIWYPASGYRSYIGGSLSNVGFHGFYWSASPYSHYAYRLSFDYNDDVYPSSFDYRASGKSVRCIKEGSIRDLASEFQMSSAIDLSLPATANSYIVPVAGSYKIKSVKGSGSESVGAVSEVSVLWESYGTDMAPFVGALIPFVVYEEGYVGFVATNKKGNAVIAAKDANGNILWSWHIWLTDQPVEQYYSSGYCLMDRNLGATSAIPGEVGALGLLYQWGRKDPFLGSSYIEWGYDAVSTITWPSPVSSESNGSVAYSISHPTTFITENFENYDWCYTGTNMMDYTRWVTSQAPKSIYDPCPPGWRVPDSNQYGGVWYFPTTSFSHYYDPSKCGMDFTGVFGYDSSIWYPNAGCRYGDGNLSGVGNTGNYWSSYAGVDMYSSVFVYSLNISCDYAGYYPPESYGNYGYVSLSTYNSRASALSVRCMRDNYYYE